MRKFTNSAASLNLKILVNNSNFFLKFSKIFNWMWSLVLGSGQNILFRNSFSNIYYSTSHLHNRVLKLPENNCLPTKCLEVPWHPVQLIQYYLVHLRELLSDIILICSSHVAPEPPQQAFLQKFPPLWHQITQTNFGSKKLNWHSPTRPPHPTG